MPPLICSAPSPSEVVVPKSEERRENCEHVDGPAKRTVGAAAEQWSKQRADQATPVAAEHGPGHRQPEHGEDAPGVQTPVEERELHGGDCGARCHWCGQVMRRLSEVGNRFGDAVGDQADAHHRREDHRVPGGPAKRRAFVVAPQAHPAVAAAGQDDEEDQESERHQQVGPAESARDAVEGRRADPGQRVPGGSPPDHDREGQGQRDVQDGAGAPAIRRRGGGIGHRCLHVLAGRAVRCDVPAGAGREMQATVACKKATVNTKPWNWHAGDGRAFRWFDQHFIGPAALSRDIS